jgi:hypothetical protein
VAKAALNKKKNISTRNLDVKFREEIAEMQHLEHSCFCGAATGTVRKVDQKYLGSFETWCRRRMERMITTYFLKMEEMLHEVKEDRNILLTINTGCSKSLCTPDDYITKNKRNYFKQFQSLIMIT